MRSSEYSTDQFLTWLWLITLDSLALLHQLSHLKSSLQNNFALVVVVEKMFEVRKE